MSLKMEENSKRIVQFKIRLTLKEKQVICQKAKQEKYNSISDYARERLLKERLSKRITVSAEYIRIFKTMDYNLTKIGTDLNQVAHKLNAYNTYMLSEEDKQTFKACFEHLKNCYALLGQYLRKIN